MQSKAIKTILLIWVLLLVITALFGRISVATTAQAMPAMTSGNAATISATDINQAEEPDHQGQSGSDNDTN